MIALINPDARVTSGAVEALATVIRGAPKVGAVRAQLIHEDGRAQASAFHFPNLRSRGARTELIDRLLHQPSPSIAAARGCEVPWVTAAPVMFRTAALDFRFF